jgi:hypothetical protein
MSRIIQDISAITGVTPSSVGGGAASMVMSYASGNLKYIETGATSYKSLANFVYGGSSVIGSIINFNVNIWVTNNGTVCLRLFDITNNNFISEIVDVTSQDESNIRSMGIISNLPSNASVIEIQGQKATGVGSSKLRLASLEVEYA